MTLADDEVRDLGRRDTVRYLRRDGTAALGAPGEQSFWATPVSGSGTQEVTW